jgi:CHASE1-domain containing sensor protein
VSAQDWATYVEALDIEKPLPGALPLVLAQPTDGPELLDLMANVRKGGEPELVVHTQTGLANRMIVRFIKPSERNATARWLDIAFEPTRPIAAITALDSGLPRVARPITLVQGRQKKVGGLLLRPIYAHSPIPTTKEERIASHVDWVYAPFFMEQALADLGAKGDGAFAVTVQDAGNTIYSDGKAFAASKYTRTQTIEVYGRTWVLTLTRTEAVEAQHNSYTPLTILVCGLATILLFGHYLRTLAKCEKNINALVERKTRALSDRTQQNWAVIENSVFGVMQLNSDAPPPPANAASCEILGIGKQT